MLRDVEHPVLDLEDGRLVTRPAPMLNALNERLRDDYIKDTIAGVGRWNRQIEKEGVPAKLEVPHRAFNRRIGPLAAARIDPDGRVVSEAEWAARQDEWLPGASDRAYVASLMGRVVEPGAFANWIAPPPKGIHYRPLDFEYVRFA